MKTIKKKNPLKELFVSKETFSIMERLNNLEKITKSGGGWSSGYSSGREAECNALITIAERMDEEENRLIDFIRYIKNRKFN